LLVCFVPVGQGAHPRLPRHDVGMRTVRQVRPLLTGTGRRAGRSGGHLNECR
jgi:hypothetical protein